MEIYIIRHGETIYNKRGIVQGRALDPSLNETGRQQAQAFFHYYKDLQFDKIYTSTLKRTHETVAPFEAMGLQIEQRSELDEIDWGELEGKKVDYALWREFRRIAEAWKNGNYSVGAKAGESAEELQKRQRNFLEKLRQSGEKKILICTHGRAMRSLLCTALEIDLNEMYSFPHSNLSLYKLSLENGVFKLEESNNREHLNGKN